MENRRTESLKPLTISLENLPASMARQESLTSYAAQRAKLLLGCYRTGDANDPETYVAAITAVLARYPEEVITSVTHPVTGLPSKKGWLPTVKEVADACNETLEPITQNEARLKRVKEQLEMREREARGEKPTLEQLKSRFGDNWGLNATSDKPAGLTFTAPTQADLRAHYSEFGLEFTPKEMIRRDDFEGVENE